MANGARLPVRSASNNTVPGSVLAAQARVIGALVVRDLRTRIQGGYAGYLVAILWPMAHFGIVLTIYLLVARPPSFGTNLILWIASGALPFIAFVYPVRLVPMAIMESSALLSFPTVKSIDIFIARSIVEFLTSFTIFVVLGAMILVILPDVKVYNLGLIFFSIFEAISLGICFGAFGFAAVRVWPKLIVLINLQTILVWATMGIFFIPDSVPEPFRTYISFNPVLHAAERMRTGIYSNYQSMTLSDLYVFGFCGVFLLLGLFIDRFVSPNFVK
ncbi:Polysialic acid transport protein KpsM [Alphaproteobacteria bacterium SO-S41]|nr:Polysialic acid transport protein KpsM [Alphaproteobacteria bacterium SO-S41]